VRYNAELKNELFYVFIAPCILQCRVIALYPFHVATGLRDLLYKRVN